MANEPHFTSRILIKEGAPSGNPPAGHLFVYLESGEMKQKDSSGTVTSFVGSSGGLVDFTETLHTSSPNNTVNAAQIEVTGGTTNVDYVATPKGTGAFILGPEPDGTATGGNKRGAGAIDLSLSRSVAAQVASGAGAFNLGTSNYSAGAGSITIGTGNNASGNDSAFCIGGHNVCASDFGGGVLGYQNFGATGEKLYILGASNNVSLGQSIAIGHSNTVSTGGYGGAVGRSNNVTGQFAWAFGHANSSSGSYSFALGSGANASGQYSLAMGICLASGYGSTAIGYEGSQATNQECVAIGRYCTASAYRGSFAFGQYALANQAGQISRAWGSAGLGFHQLSDFFAYVATTDATPTYATGPTGSSFVPGTGKTYQCNIKVVARSSTGAKLASFRRHCLVDNTGGSVSIVGSVQTDGTDIGTNAGSPPAGWGIAVAIVSSNLTVQVTGEAATNIRWGVHIEPHEITY